MTVVRLFGRPGCHLCDDARALLIELRDRPGGGFELVEVDIDRDDDLLRRFLEKIPVIEVDGRIVSELIPDRVALIGLLDNVKP